MKSKGIYLLITIIFLLVTVLTPVAAHTNSSDGNSTQVQTQVNDEEFTEENALAEEMIEEEEAADEDLETTREIQVQEEAGKVVEKDPVVEKEQEKDPVIEEEDQELVEEDLVQNSVQEKDDSLAIGIHKNSLPDEDVNYIIVEKKFEGITKEQIPDNFVINVTHNATNNLYELKNQTYPPESNIERIDTGNDLILRWKINEADAGTYTVSESGEKIEGYDVVTEGTGDIEVVASDLEIIDIELETRNNIQNWPFDDGQFFAATLTQQAVIVITRHPLSVSDRLAIEEQVRALFNQGIWQREYYFYSVEEQISTGSGFVLNGATITYNFEDSTIDIDDTSTWQHVATGNYDTTTAQNPDVTITNTYTPITKSVLIRKLITGNFGEMNRVFNFTVSVDKGVITDDDEEIDSFTLGHDETQSLTVQKGAILTLTEESGSYEVTVMVGKTEILPNEAGEYHIELSEEDIEITVTNHKDVIIDTGISLDSLPFVFILTAVTTGLGIMFVRRRKFSLEDE